VTEDPMTDAQTWINIVWKVFN